MALITIDYPPLSTSAAVQMRDLAEEMLRQGLRPTVIVPSTSIGEAWTMDSVNGVEVLRVKAPPTRDVSYVRRTINESLLPLIMIRGIARSPLAAVKWDVIAWYSPTIFFGPLVRSLKRRSGAKTYLILRDIFPEWAVDLGILRKGLAYWYFRAVAHMQYAISDTIGVQTESNLAYLTQWARKPGRRLEVLRNWQFPAPDRGSSIQLAETSLAGRKIFAYIGNMGVAQGMDILIDLAGELKSRTDIGMIFVGRGSEVTRLRDEAATRGLANVLFFDEVPSEEIPGLLAQCHAGLLALHPAHKSHNIPGKFLSYLRAGLPVLARVNAGTDLVDIVNKEGVGHAFSGDALPEMHRFAIELCDDPDLHDRMAARGRALAERDFSPTSTVRQIMAGVLNAAQT